MSLETESPESLAWAELQRRGSISPRYLRGIETEIAGELARCLDATVHEQDIRPYGAIVARETPHIDRLGRINVAGLELSVLNEAEEPLVLHQARYRDGALLIGADGQLLAVNVILRPSRASEQAVPATKGTRHTSAARHTFDRPDVIAFVVSTDGPVTVFSAASASPT